MSTRTDAAAPAEHGWIVAECESRFQNGGPRVFVCDAVGRLSPSTLSAKQAAQGAAGVESVYARRTSAGPHRWALVKQRTAVPATAEMFFCPAPNLHLSPVVGDVVAELQKAMVKFPTWPTDPLHALAVLGEEFGELTKDVLQLTYEPHKTSADNVRTEAIQTAAMAIRFAMSLDSYVYRHSVQHEQSAAGGARADTGGAS